MLIQLHGTSAATLELNSERVYILISSSKNYNMQDARGNNALARIHNLCL